MKCPELFKSSKQVQNFQKDFKTSLVSLTQPEAQSTVEAPLSSSTHLWDLPLLSLPVQQQTGTSGVYGCRDSHQFVFWVFLNGFSVLAEIFHITALD